MHGDLGLVRAKLNTAWKLNWGWSVGLLKAARRRDMEIYIYVKIVRHIKYTNINIFYFGDINQPLRILMKERRTSGRKESNYGLE